MEVLFENQYTHTEEYYNEFFGYFHFKRPSFIAINILFFMIFIMALRYMVLWGEFRSYWFMPFPLVCFVSMWSYFRGKNMRRKQELAICNGNPPESRFEITEDGIDAYYISSGVKNHVDFSQIRKVIKTKSFYFLITKLKLAYVIKKDGFTKGTPEEFLLFLREKGLKC